MTALTKNTTYYTHPTGNPTRRGGSLILRSVHVFVGALCFFHDDQVAASPRLMPARSLNNSNTPAQGGPLQVPGGDIDGTIRVIAKMPAVQFYMPTSGGGSAAAVTIAYAATYVRVIVTIGSGTTALTAYQALRAHADAMRFIDVALAGTGASAAVAITATAVPFIRVAGFAKKEWDNSGASTDLAVTEIIELDTGKCFMANDATDPASVSDVGGMVSVIDDQTIARTQVPLQLPAFLFDWLTTQAGASGPCINIP